MMWVSAQMIGYLSIWSRDKQRELEKGKVYSGYQAALTIVDPG